MNPLRKMNGRIALAVVLLLAGAARQIAGEHRPTILRPGLHLYAYVTNAGDGTVTVVDLAQLAAMATVPVGPAPSGIRAHPARDEVWGVSTAGGRVWVLDTHTNDIVAQIEVGASPFALDFSPDGRRAYVAASGSNAVVAIDCATREVVARAHVGRRPWLARATPDGERILVPNHSDGTLAILDAETLAVQAVVPVVPSPEQVVVLPDGSKAFVASSRASKVSVVGLRPPALLAHLPLGSPNGAGPADLVLKPDGGELYLPAPETHGLSVVNTAANETAEFLLLGYAPSRGVITADGEWMFVSDPTAGRVTPIRARFREVRPPISVGQQPGVARFTPQEDLLVVVNEGSNDLAVIRTRANAPSFNLVTLIPVGSRPRDLAIKAF